jgi:hypothetical protein
MLNLAKPSKTLKTKLKLNGPKTPTEDSTSKPKKSSKPKKTKAKGDEEAQGTPAEPEPTEEEKREKKEKLSQWHDFKLFCNHLTNIYDSSVSSTQATKRFLISRSLSQRRGDGSNEPTYEAT